MDFAAYLAQVPQAPHQRQDSLTDQMRDLVHLANKAGMYDAADLLRAQVAAVDHRMSQ